MTQYFVALEAPEDDGDGNWFVCRLGSLAGFLHNDNTVHQDIDDTDAGTSGWFDNEVQAHDAGSDYYVYHNMTYPYYKEYSDALQRVIDDSSKSQVMEF